MLVYGHRGFSGEYPENTMLAFRKAQEVGAEGIEYDVQLTKDGVPVVMHDENTLRTTGEDNLIRNLTCEEFLKLDAGYVKEGKFGFVPPPTLRELLVFCKETGLRSNIELKTGIYEYEGIEKKVLELLDEFGLRETTLISSFNHYSVMRFRALAPDVRVGLLDESWLVNAGEYVKMVGADDMNPCVHFVTKRNVQELKEHGCGINVWTVNSDADMKRMLELGIDIGISNYPDRFLKLRNQFEQQR